MNTIKSLGMVGLAITGLFAAQAFATPAACPAGMQGSPTCIATTRNSYNEPTLEELLGDPAKYSNSIFSDGSGINPYTDQMNPASYWSVNGSGGSENTLVLTLTGNAPGLTFGIYNPNDTSKTLTLFDGGTSGYSTSLRYYKATNTFAITQLNENGGLISSQNNLSLGTGNLFGYYLSTGSKTWYSDMTLDADGKPHMVAYAGAKQGDLKLTGGMFSPGEYLQAWEDGSDWDYNDFVVMVESVHPVPEPAELGMFGLGMLLIGGFVALRRRSLKA
jgi:hypothetical protein